MWKLKAIQGRVSNFSDWSYCADLLSKVLMVELWDCLKELNLFQSLIWNLSLDFLRSNAAVMLLPSTPITLKTHLPLFYQ